MDDDVDTGALETTSIIPQQRVVLYNLRGQKGNVSGGISVN
jgi:hypothetical protein